MLADEDEDWGWEAQANTFTRVLTAVSLTFGGLSVVALLNVGAQDAASWILSDILRKWDTGLRFVLGPLGGLLEAGAHEVRVLGFDASIRPVWPHVVLVALLTGLAGFANVRGWYWFSGAAWFVGCAAIGFVVLSGAGWSSYASLEVASGFDLGARVTGLVFLAAAILAVMVRILLYVWPDILLEFVVKVGRLFGAIRVALCFIGAGLILIADNLGQMLFR
jgi:hypothetical protein